MMLVVLAFAASVLMGGNSPAHAQAAVPTGSPSGHLDSVAAAPGGVAVHGWALDPATAAPITVGVSSDGRRIATVTANAVRTDVGRRLPKFGARHGFAAHLLLIDGTHTVCVVALNVARGADRSLGCARIRVANDPDGHLDVASATAGRLTVAGWALDPNSPAAPLTVSVAVGNSVTTLPAADERPDVARRHQGAGAAHGFSATLAFPQGTHTVCVSARNIGFGRSSLLRCLPVTLNESPGGSLEAVAQTPGGLALHGWAFDPDQPTAPLSVAVQLDGASTASLTASGTRADIARAYPTAGANHGFSTSFPLAQGSHTVCLTARNLGYGSDLAFGCRTVVLNFNPYGRIGAISRVAGRTNLVVTGWAIDPDTTNPISVSTTLDGRAEGTVLAGIARPDVTKAHPGTGTSHGFSTVLSAGANEHTVCVTALNVAGGTANTALGCTVVNAVHPLAPGAPAAVLATPGYGGATISWGAPASDGGAPCSAYTITASPGGATMTVGATATTATLMGLASNRAYTFAVVARNVVGPSVAAVSGRVTTQATPPAQSTPAPISTSRYIRNINSGSAAEQAMMHAEGAADAKANPSGHGYLALLDIGGQDEASHGVVLSAGVRFVSYAHLVSDLNAYVDGYRSQQKPSAPVVIALGTRRTTRASRSPARTTSNQASRPTTRRRRAGSPATWPRRRRRSSSTARPTAAPGPSPTATATTAGRRPGCISSAAARPRPASSACRRSTTTPWPRSGSSSR
jgi:hypothetical protein